MTELDLYIKGEPPVSAKFNAFTTSFSDDLNIIARQIDYLSAILISNNNIFASEVEQEKNFINRIRSKTKILQMYSTGPANDLYYIGNSFDSSDYIDFSKNENKDRTPLVQNGKMTLGINSVDVWRPENIEVLSGSNGYFGTNHSAYIPSSGDANYKYHFIDTPTSRNIDNIRDNNPLSFFEYEQIQVLNKNAQSRDFEYKYVSRSGSDIPTEYVDWSSFAGNSLDLNISLKKTVAETANYVHIIPYFGDGNNISKEIVVSKVEIVNDRDQVENILQDPIYIGSTFIPPSIEAANRFYIKDAKLYFSERRVKKINISFQQFNANPISIKHLYFSPDPTRSQSTPYANQTRFNPDAPTVTANLQYPSIPWSSINYNVSDLVPNINQPNLFKSEVFNTKSIDVTLSRQIPNATGTCIKVRGLDGVYYRITGNFYDNFNSEIKQFTRYSTLNNQNLSQYISSAAVSSTENISRPYLWIDGTNSDIQDIVDWFGNSTQATSAEKYQKFNLDPTFPAQRETINTSDTKLDSRRFPIQLVRQYEMLNGQRRSIGIRDINVGYEKFNDRSEMVSRRYDVSSEIEYMTISSEVDFSGTTSSTSAEAVKYYISLDDGLKWLPISSIENPFSNTPEVLAFNLNIDQNFKIPGVSYYSQPDIPNSIKSFLIKIELNKPTGSNITPIIYSYKVGVKVKQV